MTRKTFLLALLALMLGVVAMLPEGGVHRVLAEYGIGGDFTVVLSARNTIYYSEYYLVAPAIVETPKTLSYGTNIVCRSFSASIVSFGRYSIAIAVNGTEQRIDINGGMVSVKLVKIDTGETSEESFVVPGLNSIYISLVPAYVTVVDPETGASKRMNVLSLFMHIYGSEDIRKSYNISNLYPSIQSIVVNSFQYTAISAMSYYMTLYFGTSPEPFNIMIAFTPEAGQAISTVTSPVTTTATVTSVSTSYTTIYLPTIVTQTATTTTTQAVPTTVVTTVTALPSPITHAITFTTASTTTETVTATTTVEKEKAVESGYSIYTLVGAVIATAVVSIAITALIARRGGSR